MLHVNLQKNPTKRSILWHSWRISLKVMQWKELLQWTQTESVGTYHYLVFTIKKKAWQNPCRLWYFSEISWSLTEHCLIKWFKICEWLTCNWCIVPILQGCCWYYGWYWTNVLQIFWWQKNTVTFFDFTGTAIMIQMKNLLNIEWKNMCSETHHPQR